MTDEWETDKGRVTKDAIRVGRKWIWQKRKHFNNEFLMKKGKRENLSVETADMHKTLYMCWKALQNLSSYCWDLLVGNWFALNSHFYCRIVRFWLFPLMIIEIDGKIHSTSHLVKVFYVPWKMRKDGERLKSCMCLSSAVAGSKIIPQFPPALPFRCTYSRIIASSLEWNFLFPVYLQSGYRLWVYVPQSFGWWERREITIQSISVFRSLNAK